MARLDGHFAPFAACFSSSTRSVSGMAERYLHGLYQADRANLERMSEVMPELDHQRLHHAVSVAQWDRTGILRQLATEANAHFGRGGRALVIDESGFAKKGAGSAGVARQWNGRLGKTDNCQVGVFAAITRDGVAALVDGELYLPTSWTDDPKRCCQVGIPEDARAFRSKGEIALGMVRRARRHGLAFDWVAVDGGYGHLPWLLTTLEDDGERFLADVHENQSIYLADPSPTHRPQRGKKRRAPTRVTAETAVTVADWVARQPDQAWRRMKIRDGEKGEVIAAFLTQRVYVWDGTAPQGRHWHLLVRRETDGTKLKYSFSNAKPSASLRQLVDMQASRFFVERTFEDGKSACGMADYQMRSWSGWHQHMLLVMIALMFLAKERLALRETHQLLSCQDLVEILRYKLPRKISTDAELVAMIVDRHKRRRKAAAQHYEKQGLTPPSSFGATI
jgi:SRSO17 transposase